MSDQTTLVNVQLRGDKGAENYQVELPKRELTLLDVFEAVSGQEWGCKLFETGEDGKLKAVAGTLVVLNNRMIQPWDVGTTAVQHDDQLRFVPVVAGG